MKPLLIEKFEATKNKKPLFSQLITVDFYDGPVEGLGNLIHSNVWFVFSLVYFDPPQSSRIFTLLEVKKNWLSENEQPLRDFQINGNQQYADLKSRIRDFYNEHSGGIFLFKSSSILSIEYDLVQIDRKELEYFADVEQVLSQNKIMKWIEYFHR